MKNEIDAEILALSGRHCCICKKFKPLEIQIHHIVEKADGGTDDFENLIPICISCHSNIHTKPKMTKQFTPLELKKHRNFLYELVKEGKLPNTHTEETSTKLFEKVIELLSESKERTIKKCSERALRILMASYVDESPIKIWEIPLLEDEQTQLSYIPYFIETGNQQFLSEISNKNDIPEEIQELVELKLIKKGSVKEYKITFKGISYCDDLLQTTQKFTMVKFKCLECSLHFILLTDYPENHKKDSTTCPECGNKNGNFIIWRERVFGHIYEHVPGNSK